MKRFVAFSLLVLFILSFSAISFAKTTNIVFWYPLSGSKGAVFKKIVEEFNKVQSDVHVKLVYTGKYRDTAQKVSSAIAAGALPNAGLIPAGPIFTGPYNNYTIYNFVKNDPDLNISDFYKVALDYATYKGKLAGLPYNISVPVLYYNKELMKKAGLDPNTPPDTWDELLSFAKKITKDINNDKTPDIWGVNMADTPWIFKCMLLQNNCNIIDSNTLTPLFDSKKGIEAAQFWKKLVDEKAMPVGLHRLADKQFLANSLGFYMGSSSRIGRWSGKVKFDWDVAFLPKKEKRAVAIGGAVLEIFPHSKEEDEAAWKLIKWLISPPNMAEFCMKTGYIPIRRSILSLSKVKKFLDNNPKYKAAYEEMKYGIAYYHFQEMGTMDGLLWEALDKLERGVMSPEDAMKEAAKKLKEEIEKK